ncbi:putative manganese transporter [Alphaproteobacteria bacterium]|nr:putative manganese transporter [Alphaproteobacteria bacterium]MDC3269873.1 putative manganese transporter [Alphaproteobacteria bacterium]
MNALISAIKDKQKIMFANEGRLLKKSFFGLIILALAFQTGEFGNIIRESMVDAYLAVSVFVGFTLMVFIGLDSLTKFDIQSFLEKTKNLHVPIASFLGAIPGCGGAIIVVTQYIQGRISFGALVAVLTATMGDAAFLILAMEPSTGLLIFVLGIFVGTISGYVVDLIHGRSFMMTNSDIQLEFEKLKKTFVSKFNIFWLMLFVPGFIIGILLAFQIDVDNFLNLPSNVSIVIMLGSGGAILSIFMWSLNPLSDFQCSTDKSRGFLSRVIDTTNFVSTWVISGFLVFEIFMYFTNIDLKLFFDLWLPFVPLIAILFGFLPGCGPQIVVATFYLNGYIPLSAELGNAISNDGDALFPAIALAPKAAILATIYSAFPAIIVAYTYLIIFEL